MAKIQGFVYKWVNRCSGKFYIGSHAGSLDDGYTGSGKAFKAAIQKHGIDQFDRTILEQGYYETRNELLLAEKVWLDSCEAYSNRLSYNIAKDVIGGDTKAGWTPAERAEFSSKISKIWAERSEDDKAAIADKRFITQGGMWFTEDARLAAKNADRTNNIKSLKARTFDNRSKSAKKACQTLGPEGLKARSKKAVQNRNPITEALAIVKRKETIASWTQARREQAFDARSNGRKGKGEGSSNGRARKVSTPVGVFGSLREAANALQIHEETLRRWIKSKKIGYSYL